MSKDRDDERNTGMPGEETFSLEEILAEFGGGAAKPRWKEDTIPFPVTPRSQRTAPSPAGPPGPGKVVSFPSGRREDPPPVPPRERLFVRSVAERRPVRGRYGERIRFFAEIVARDREVEPRDRQFVRNRQRDRRDPSGFQRSVDLHAEASRLVTVLVVSRETDVAADVARTQE